MIRLFNRIFTVIVMIFTISTLSVAQEVSVKDILKKVERYDSITYSVDIRSSTKIYSSNSKVKIWRKNGYQRQDSLMSSLLHKSTSISIFRPEGYYLFYPKEKVYTKYDNQTHPMKVSMELLDESFFDDQPFVVSGVEKIDGKLATLVTTVRPYGELKQTVKTWIWNDKGLPLKVEYLTEDPNDLRSLMTQSRTIMTFHYFSFEDIPDDFFDISQMTREYSEVKAPEVGGTVSSPTVSITLTDKDSEEYKKGVFRGADTTVNASQTIINAEFQNENNNL